MELSLFPSYTWGDKLNCLSYQYAKVCGRPSIWTNMLFYFRPESLILEFESQYSGKHVASGALLVLVPHLISLSALGKLLNLFMPHFLGKEIAYLGHMVACEVCEVTQSCPTLCDPMDCSLPGFSLHGISQARILEWVAFPSPGNLPDSGIEPGSPTLWAAALTSEPPGKPNTVAGED